MSVWLCVPSKRTPAQADPVFRRWRERGYFVAVARDEGDLEVECDHLCYPWPGPYRGYAETVNYLCKHVLAHYPKAEWLVCAGDDTLPDPNHSAEEIAQQCNTHFAIRVQTALWCLESDSRLKPYATFGVMQPTGDPWSDSRGRIIERIAGSPWIGREFARRMYGGAGPYWHEYTHCFVDEELQCVAQKLGVFWQRPDLIHHHQNWARPKNQAFPFGDACDMPEFLREANSPEHWAKYSAIFKARKAAGFPGHEPIP